MASKALFHNRDLRRVAVAEATTKTLVNPGNAKSAPRVTKSSPRTIIEEARLAGDEERDSGGNDLLSSPSQEFARSPLGRSKMERKSDDEVFRESLKELSTSMEDSFNSIRSPNSTPPTPRKSIEEIWLESGPDLSPIKKEELPSVDLPKIEKKGHHRKSASLTMSSRTVTGGHRRTQSLTKNKTWSIETIEEHSVFNRDRTVSEAQPPSGRKYFNNKARNTEKFDANDLDSLKRHLVRKQTELGKRHPRVGEVHNLIGNVYFRCRQYPEAIESYKATLTCDVGAKGPSDCAPIAAALGNLGTVCSAMKEMDQSLEYLEHALSVHIFIEQAQGKDTRKSIQIASCLYQIGCTQCLRQEFGIALKKLRTCQEIQVRLLGNDHVDVARTLDAIGKAHFGLKDYNQAMKYHKDALEIKRRADAGDSSGVLTSMRNVASVHEARNEHKQAIDQYLHLFTLQKSQLARLKRRHEDSSYCQPAVVRLAMEAGETLVSLSKLYDKTGEEKLSVQRGREATLFFKEAGVGVNDLNPPPYKRGGGVWSSA